MTCGGPPSSQRLDSTHGRIYSSSRAQTWNLSSSYSRASPKWKASVRLGCTASTENPVALAGLLSSPLVCLCVHHSCGHIRYSRWRRVGRAQQPPRRVCMCVCRDTHTAKGQKLLCDGDDAQTSAHNTRDTVTFCIRMYNATPTELRWAATHFLQMHHAAQPDI